MGKNAIVIKKPGELVHENYLGHVVKMYQAYMGTALVHEGKLITDRKVGRPTVDAVMELQKAFQAEQIVFCFGDHKTLLVEDMMPYDIVIDAEKGFNIALFMDGNFNGYEVKGSSHDSTFHVKEEFLKLKLPKLYKTANNGMAGLLTELNDGLTQQELSNCWTDRGFITLLAAEGPAVTVFNKGNIQQSKYNWGHTSQNLGYVEKTESKSEPAKEAVQELTLAERLKAKIRGESVEPKPAAKPAELPPEKKTETSVVHNNNLPENIEWVGPAPSQLTNQQKKDWWLGEIGYVPEAFKKDNVKVQRIKGTKRGVLAGLSKGIAGTGPQPDVKDAASPISASEMKVDPKTLPDKKEAPVNAKDTSSKHVSTDNMPTMSPRQKLMLKNGWMKDAEVVKTLGDDFTVLAFDPKKLKEFEENYQTFWDGIGMEPRWLSFEAISKLGVDDLKALCQFAFNAQNELFKTSVRLTSILSDPNNKLRAAM